MGGGGGGGVGVEQQIQTTSRFPRTGLLRLLRIRVTRPPVNIIKIPDLYIVNMARAVNRLPEIIEFRI